MVSAVRFVWAFAVPYLIRAIDRRAVAARAPRGAGASGVVGAGRGCAAPSRWPRPWPCRCRPTPATPLPGRDLILFITFAVILFTLVGQGLTLPLLIRRLGVREDGAEEESEEVRARLRIARAALERLDELAAEDWTRDGHDRAGPRRCTNSAAAGSRSAPARSRTRTGIEDRSLAYQRLMHEIYAAQRDALVELRNSGEISGEVDAPDRARDRPRGVPPRDLSAARR